jgi:hypothetical protein
LITPPIRMQLFNQDDSTDSIMLIED